MGHISILLFGNNLKQRHTECKTRILMSFIINMFNLLKCSPPLGSMLDPVHKVNNY